MTQTASLILSRYKARKNRLNAQDVLIEALLGLSGHLSRLLLLIATTTLGIGALVATIGFGQTGSQQVMSRIDALASTQAVVKTGNDLDPLGNATMPWDADARVERLNGVVRAGLIAQVDVGDARISSAPLLDPTEPPIARPTVLAVTPGILETVNGRLMQGTFLSAFHENRAENAAVLGAKAADALKIDRVDNQPTVFIGDRSYVVIGIVSGVERRQELLDSVILPQSTARRDLGLQSPGELQVHIRLGAGDLLAEQAPIILNPADPTAFDVIAPPATTDFREELLADVNVLFLILGGIALLIGGLSIAIVSSMSVMDRRGEIGLRRALGATKGQVLAQIVAENAIIGFMGGLIGTSAGTVIVLAGAFANGWTPVLDPRVGLAALVLGTAVGLVAGLSPAFKAARLEPSTALQEGT